MRCLTRSWPVALPPVKGWAEWTPCGQEGMSGICMVGGRGACRAEITSCREEGMAKGSN